MPSKSKIRQSSVTDSLDVVAFVPAFIAVRGSGRYGDTKRCGRGYPPPARCIGAEVCGKAIRLCPIAPLPCQTGEPGEGQPRSAREQPGWIVNATDGGGMRSSRS